jgi:hypothetical protein
MDTQATSSVAVLIASALEGRVGTLAGKLSSFAAYSPSCSTSPNLSQSTPHSNSRTGTKVPMVQAGHGSSTAQSPAVRKRMATEPATQAQRAAAQIAIATVALVVVLTVVGIALPPTPPPIITTVFTTTTTRTTAAVSAVFPPASWTPVAIAVRTVCMGSPLSSDSPSRVLPSAAIISLIASPLAVIATVPALTAPVQALLTAATAIASLVAPVIAARQSFSPVSLPYAEQSVL